MKYMSFKIREVLLYYYDYNVDYNIINQDHHKYLDNGKKERLFHFKNSAQDHIQLLLDEYPSRFTRETADTSEKLTKYKKSCFCLCKKPIFDEIESIKYSIEKMQLTEDQYNIFKNEYISKLRYLERRKTKFKKLFCLSNTILQVGSVMLPALITIKDNVTFNDGFIKKFLDTGSIFVSLIMGVVTNLTVFFKVNQRYSLYTQYDNKLKQEMRRFITYSEKYNDDQVKETYRLFPQFSLAIENYIEELSNQEYDYIVGNKEKTKMQLLKKKKFIVKI